MGSADQDTAEAPRAGGRRRERTENAAMRRRQLVAATMRSIAERGLAGTTLATVSKESGLSQGVAVFYFETKERLLAEVLSQLYARYEAVWRAALAAAGDAPGPRVEALVRADFDAEVCNPEALVLWHAFWGEASARPLYAEIAERHDRARAAAMKAAAADLLAARGWERAEAEGRAGPLATAIEALTDGLWLRIYLSNGELTAAAALDLALVAVEGLFAAPPGGR